MPRNKTLPILALVAAALAVAESPAQVATTLLKPGDTLDWQGQSRTVSRVFQPQFNQYGCRGTSIELAPLSGGPETVYWGSCQGEAPRVLRGARTIGGLQQASVDPANWGFDGAGEIVYHASLSTVGDSVWVGDTLFVRRSDPVTGMVDRFFTNPGAFGVIPTTSAGPLFVSSIMNGTGDNRGVGLFQGSPPVPLLLSDALIPGLSTPLSGHPLPPFYVWRFVDVSPDGSHWCAAVDLLSSGSALVVDGQAATANGLPIETGAPVPPAVAIQATWTSIIDVSVDDQGSWTALLAYELPGGGRVEAVFRDGVPIIREGTSVGSQGPIFSIDQLHTSRNGRLGFVANMFSMEPFLVVDRRVALVAGDDIDYTGDGVVDPGFTVQRIGTFSAGTELDDDGTVWINALIGLPSGGDDWVLLEVAGFELGSPFCSPGIANSTGVPARIGASGHAVAGGLPLTLRATELPANTHGFFLASRTTANVPMAGGSQGTLCLGGFIGRFAAQIVNSGPDGTFEIDVDTTNIPRLGTVAVQPGETWTFQAWYRDANPATGSNLTDAVQVTFD